jgi:hypothetical protein
VKNAFAGPELQFSRVDTTLLLIGRLQEAADTAALDAAACELGTRLWLS